MFQLVVGNGVLDHDDGVVQVAALDEVHLHQRLEFVQEDEGAAGGDFSREVVTGIEGGVLVADDFRVVVDVERYGEFVVGEEDDGHALLGNGVDHLLGHLEVFAFRLLLFEARLDDGPGIFAGRTVHDGGFGSVDIDDGVVHAQRPEGRHDVFDGADAVAGMLDGRAARGVYDIVAERRNFRAAFEVDAPEDDAAVGLGGTDGHVDADPGM